MIGQSALLSVIDSQIKNNMFPKFSIIVGQSGSGKHVIVKYIYEKLGKGILINLGNSVSDVRQAISQAYNIKGDVVFCVFYNADKMSASAKNALLKIVEEPPKNVYFIMTLESIDNTLATIVSRATVYNMNPYSPTEIGEYAEQYNFNSEELNIVADVCEVPGEVDALYGCGAIGFNEYVKSVVDYIAEVSGANCFKIANRIKFKDEDTGYDLKLFFKLFIVECNRRLLTDVVKYAAGIKVTTKAMQQLNVTGISKSNLFDIWILDIRKEWLE